MNYEDNVMEKFSLDKMQDIQKELQEKYGAMVKFHIPFTTWHSTGENKRI